MYVHVAQNVHSAQRNEHPESRRVVELIGRHLPAEQIRYGQAGRAETEENRGPRQVPRPATSNDGPARPEANPRPEQRIGDGEVGREQHADERRQVAGHLTTVVQNPHDAAISQYGRGYGHGVPSRPEIAAFSACRGRSQMRWWSSPRNAQASTRPMTAAVPATMGTSLLVRIGARTCWGLVETAVNCDSHGCLDSRHRSFARRRTDIPVQQATGAVVSPESVADAVDSLDAVGNGA